MIRKTHSCANVKRKYGFAPFGVVHDLVSGMVLLLLLLSTFDSDYLSPTSVSFLVKRNLAAALVVGHAIRTN